MYIVANDTDAAQRFSSSDAPLNRWFRELMQEVHGVDISQPLPPLHKVHDARVAEQAIATLSGDDGRAAPA